VKETSRTLLYIGLIAGTVTLLLVGFLVREMTLQSDNTLAKARLAAQMIYEADLSFRHWNASHGGVYAPVTEKTKPNPYLSVPERDITTKKGKQLTLINPAYMMRQLYEGKGREDEIRGHITSLNPLRPENRPDPWEEQSLREFEKGVKETVVIEKKGDREFLRLMRPMITAESCLKCHSRQGYRIGDIRGGISATVFLTPFRKLAAERMAGMWATYGLLWIVMIGGIIFFGARQLKNETQRLRDEALLKKSEERYRQFVKFSSDGIWCFEMDPPVAVSADPKEQVGQIYQRAALIECNDTMAKMHNYREASEMIGMKFGTLIPRLSKKNVAYLENFVRFGYVVENHESQQLDRMGNVRYFQDSMTGVVENGFLIRIWGIQHDITELKELNEQLESLSITDGLTGLYNRRGFLTLSNQQMRIADRMKRGMLLVFVDLDGLKWINDRLGHQQGDDALKGLAGILKKTFRESDISARMGGDEFVVLALEGRPEDAENLAGKIRHEIALYNEDRSRPYNLSVSVGVVYYDPNAPVDLEQLVNEADRLMYLEKGKKKRDASVILRRKAEGD